MVMMMMILMIELYRVKITSSNKNRSTTICSQAEHAALYFISGQ